MKVCLIGDTEGPRDEGMRNTNLYLSEELRKNAELLVIGPREYLSPRVFMRIKEFCPDIIHYLQGPTIRSLFLCRVLRFIFPKTKIVLLATNPALKRYHYPFLPYLAPHHVFSLTKRFNDRLTHLGISSQIVCIGVDQDRFLPVTEEKKAELRKTLQIPVGRRVILHVGHFSEARGVLTLGRLQNELGTKVQFLIVGSSTNRPQSIIVEKLRNQGVRVITDFIPRIEEIYQASDAYIFPGLRSDSAIDVPLSVLEAMAVNLPVITTRFGGLTDMFEEKPWFRYVDTVNSIKDAINDILFTAIESKTREMVMPYTWDIFAKTIINTYKRIENKGKKS